MTIISKSSNPINWVAAAVLFFFSVDPTYSQNNMRLVETRKIYDNDSYCAFTSLVEFRGNYYCTFREASRHHIKFNDPATWGRIILIKSDDTKKWQKVAEFRQDSTDMRDPKIKVTPDGEKLILIYHKHRIRRDNQEGGYSVARYFTDSNFSSEEQIIYINGKEDEHPILWNVTNYKNKLYGFDCGTKFMLVSSTDGVNYNKVADFTEWANENQGMNESCIVFDGRKAYVVVRSTYDHACFGESRYPFKRWKWKGMKISVGGPNLYKLNRRVLLLGSRDYGQDINRGKTVIYKIHRGHWTEAEKCIVLESTNDSSYPCIIDGKDNHLLVSYYSGDADHSNIYLADIVLE